MGVGNASGRLPDMSARDEIDQLWQLVAAHGGWIYVRKSIVLRSYVRKSIVLRAIGMTDCSELARLRAIYEGAFNAWSNSNHPETKKTLLQMRHKAANDLYSHHVSCPTCKPTVNHSAKQNA
jgi:hypothetical protein